MMPFTSMVLSVVLLGESPGWQQWSGGMLIIIGMFMIGIGDAAVKKPVLQLMEVEGPIRIPKKGFS